MMHSNKNLDAMLTNNSIEINKFLSVESLISINLEAIKQNVSNVMFNSLLESAI